MAQEPDIDVGAITEALNNKTDTDGANVLTSFGAGIYAAAAVIPMVEFEYQADNNQQWYMLYANGWLIQGGLLGGTGSYGTHSVTYIKEFNSNPHLSITSTGIGTAPFTGTGGTSERFAAEAAAPAASSSATGFVTGTYYDKYWIAFGFNKTT